MNLEELQDILRGLVETGDDPEVDHIHADDALIDYINDPVVAELWSKLKKWYA